MLGGVSIPIQFSVKPVASKSQLYLFFNGFPYLNYSGKLSAISIEMEKRMAWKYGLRWNLKVCILINYSLGATKASGNFLL